MTALVTGCFDILHVGHVRLLQHVGRLSGVHEVVVGINSDASYERVRGVKPCVSEGQREETLRAFRSVTDVVVFDEDDARHPAYWVKGGDYVGKVVPEMAVCEQIGCQVVFVPYEKTMSEGLSSTALREAVLARAKE
jgi:cytidyltransferase-like protein